MRARDRRRYGWALLGAVMGAALVLVVAAAAADTAVVDPSFVPGVAFDAGIVPTDVAVADLNGDHAPDLAVAACYTTETYDGESVSRSEVKILLDDGSGGFRPGQRPPLPPNTQTCSLASADFNGDGAADLAVAISSGHTLALLLGDGAGRFTSGVAVPVGGTPTSVLTADVSGDGHPDLLVPVADSSGRVTGIEILLGDGLGGFAEAAGSPVSILAGRELSLAVADLDVDGKADLAVANTQRNDISVLRGDGAGGFAPAASVASARQPREMAIGDFDGNGKQDLAAVTSNGIAVLLGDGSGVFDAAPGSPARGGGDLAVSDLNGDGSSDLATTGTEGSSVPVQIATGEGRFRPAVFSPFPAAAPYLLAAGDFNGDGKADLAALTVGAPLWPVGPRGSVVLLQTDSTPVARPGRALHARDSIATTRKRISALAADGEHFAACAGDRPIAWGAPGRRPVTFKTREYGFGGCRGLTVTADRVAWIEGVACGNTSCTDGLFSARLSGGRRRELDEQENDCGAGPCFLTGVWISQLLGAGSLIAWNDWAVDCTADCDEEEEGFERYAIVGQALKRFSGGRVARVRHDSAARPLLAVGGGRMALQVGGRVVVLKPNGKQVAAAQAPGLESVALARAVLAVADHSALRLFNPATGHLRKAIPLGPSAALQLAGVTSRLALLRGPHVLELVRLGDGTLISFPLMAPVAKRLVDAKLTAAGLFYAYNVANGKRKGRVVFERTSKLLGRF